MNLKTDMNIKKILEQKIVIAILAIVSGILLGFYFKTFDADFRNSNLKNMSKIQEERYLAHIKKYNSLFTLTNKDKPYGQREYWDSGKFEFNWLVFVIGTIISYLILLTNKYIDIKKVFYPYLKEVYK